MTQPGSVTLYGTMLVGVSLAMLDIQVTNAILPILGQDLRASIRELGTVQTIYLSAEIISIFTARQLIARFHASRVFAFSCFGFAAASLGCAASTGLAMFLAARFFQGLFAGAMVPIASDARFRLFPAEKQPLIGSIVILVLTAAPTFGPWVGAWITEATSWRMVFAVNVPIAAMVGLGTLRRLDSSATMVAGHRVPWAALIYFALVAVIAHAVLEMIAADRAAWRDGRLPLIGIAGVLAILMGEQARSGRKLVAFAPLAQPGFLVMAIVTAVLTAVQVGLNFTIPLFAQTVAGASVDEAARILLIAGLSQMLGAPLMWLVLDKIGVLPCIVVGSTLIVVSLCDLSHMDPTWTIAEFAPAQVMRGIGFMFVASTTHSIMMGRVPPPLIPDATVLVSASRNLAAMLAILLSATYLDMSYQGVLDAGLVAGPGFDRAVGATADAADAYVRMSRTVGFQAISAFLALITLGSAGAAIIVAWHRQRSSANQQGVA